MATGDKKTGMKATDEKILEVKKEEDENSDGEKIPKDEDDVPKGQKDKSRKMKTGTGKKSGSKAYDDTPLPEEDDDSVDEDKDAEDQGPADRARSSKDDEEAWKKSEAEQKAQYQRRLNFLMEEDEKIQKAKNEKSRRGQKDDVKVGDAVDEGPTEGEAVGVT